LHSKVLDWNTSDTLDILKKSMFSFNIMPTAQAGRIKDQYELLAMTKETDEVGPAPLGQSKLGYEPRYYLFNNTRMQFPSIKFSEAEP